MINGMHHVAVATADIYRLVEFYTSALGFEIVSRGGWHQSEVADRIVGLRGSTAQTAMMRVGNLYVELFQYDKPAFDGHSDDRTRAANSPGYTHFCLDVTDIENEYSRLSARGVQFNCPPQLARGGMLKTTYGRDPDGNIFELQEVLSSELDFPLAALPMLARWHHS